MHQKIGKKLTEEGWDKLIDKFLNKYDVFFDSKSGHPVPNKSFSILPYLGHKEGLTTVGENADQVVKVDKVLFCNAFVDYLKDYEKINAIDFFQIIHLAYEKAIGSTSEKKLNFYHIHNPSSHAQLNFVRLVPHAKWIMMARNPSKAVKLGW